MQVYIPVGVKKLTIFRYVDVLVLPLGDQVLQSLVVDLVAAVEVELTQVEGVGMFCDEGEGDCGDVRTEFQTEHFQLRRALEEVPELGF